MIGFTRYWPSQMASSQRTIDHILVVFQFCDFQRYPQLCFSSVNEYKADRGATLKYCSNVLESLDFELNFVTRINERRLEVL